MTSAIINKILHDPLTLLKKKDEGLMSDLYLDTIRAIFQLTEESLEKFSDQTEKEDGNAGI